MELLSVGRLVEVEVASEDLVSTLAAEDHLATRGLHPSGQEEHGSRSADRGQVERLEHRLDHQAQQKAYSSLISLPGF